MSRKRRVSEPVAVEKTDKKTRNSIRDSGVSQVILERPSKPGIVLTFGQGDFGQLGLGTDMLERIKPTPVPGLEEIVNVCAGGMHTVSLSASGDVFTFGCNDDGILGRESDDETSFVPGKVSLPLPAVQISAGDAHSAALLEDGRVFAWGTFRDQHGSVGLTSAGIQQVPIELLKGIKVSKIASGENHLVLLSADGRVFTSGCAEQGQLGRVTKRSADRMHCRQKIEYLLEPSSITLKVRDAARFDNVFAGTCCTYARASRSNSIYAFGLNNFSQCGLDDKTCYYFPTVSAKFAQKFWQKISCGEHHSLALDKSGIVYVIGRHEYGRLGLGEGAQDVDVLTVVPALQHTKCIDVSCGSRVSFAVTESGDVYSWGTGTNSQLGHSGDDDVYEPTIIKAKNLEGKQVLRVSAGGQHTVILAGNS